MRMRCSLVGRCRSIRLDFDVEILDSEVLHDLKDCARLMEIVVD